MNLATMEVGAASGGSKAVIAPAHLAVLRRAAHDDGFRSLLATDPVSALGQCGVATATSLPSHVCLPDKTALQALLNDVDSPSDVQGQWFGFLNAKPSHCIH
ncbi:MAG: hypothetical protein HC897_04700 [Thermoanaerobaculia bacterium]|nr:hypothetical protein [Thermoanaerobaculia bacterium]